jgi:hypothetical protein
MGIDGATSFPQIGRGLGLALYHLPAELGNPGFDQPLYKIRWERLIDSKSNRTLAGRLATL